jgi:hypothetical protein
MLTGATRRVSFNLCLSPNFEFSSTIRFLDSQSKNQKSKNAEIQKAKNPKI